MQDLTGWKECLSFAISCDGIVKIVYCSSRFTQKGNLEVQMFILTSNLRENHQKMYQPPEGKMMSDINRVGCRCSIIVMI